MSNLSSTQAQAGKAAKQALASTYGVSITILDPATGATAATVMANRQSSERSEQEVSGAMCEVIKRTYLIPYQATLTTTPRKGAKIVDESLNWWVQSVDADSAQSHWKVQTLCYRTTALGVN